jgi:phosphoribosylaminoimidazolecarboxamide formyltransferase/IMP cyclohydrolase
MVRSAAKNHADVAIVTDPDDYGRVLDEMQKEGGALSDGLRRELARKAFGLTARYDAAISRWLLREENAGAGEVRFPESLALAGAKVMDLRYGENPHQSAAFFRLADCAEPSVASADFLGGKELSYNNLVDLDGALGLAKEFEQPFACVVKHTNPCGAACGEKVEEALELAWAGDPLSAFGSVLAFTRAVNLAAAEFLVSENRFVEAIIAPGFDEDALELLRTGPKWGKNVRLLSCGKIGPDSRDPNALEVKVLTGGFLAQTRDLVRESTDMLKCVTKREPSDEEIESLLFGNKITKHVKSNSIVITKGLRVLGVGAGQMSRVDSVKIAAEKAGAEAKGAVLASDAFFPFPDGVEAAAAAGVKAFVQPGGSIRDKQVIETCDELGVSMIFTGKRHFRH